VSFLHVYWNFEPIVAFTVLLAVNGLVAERDNRSALAIALGAVTKLFPLILLGAVWRFRPIREALRQTLIAGAITAAVLLGMVVVGGDLGKASLAVQFNKASYETVWALLDGNHKTGLLDPDHLHAERAYVLQGNPSVISWLPRLVVFGGIGLFVFVRARRRDSLGIVAFITITIVIFFLWSQGWSPQWQVTLFPLILLCFPNQTGVLFCITLAFIGLGEFPILFSRGMDRLTGQFKPEALPIFVALVVLRTILLAGLAVGLYRILRISVPRAKAEPAE
jgi:hypothetical protein